MKIPRRHSSDGIILALFTSLCFKCLRIRYFNQFLDSFSSSKNFAFNDKKFHILSLDISGTSNILCSVFKIVKRDRARILRWLQQLELLFLSESTFFALFVEISLQIINENKYKYQGQRDHFLIFRKKPCSSMIGRSLFEYL